MLDIKHYVGLDLGQVSDYTALVSLRREQEIPDHPKPVAHDPAVAGWAEALIPPAAKPPAPAKYFCNIAERFERGMSYLTLADNVCKLFQELRFAGQVLVIDGTGVGRPVVDMFRKSHPNCRIMPVTITGGASVGGLASTRMDELGYWHVPKKELVGSVQVLLGTGRLEVAPGLRYAGVLIQELKSFSYKINPQTAHVSLESWRERDHDDIVLALALAAWAGERAQQQLWIL